jgi:hypothetical protein
MDLSSGDTLIVEGLVLTQAADGSPHLAPMGPVVDRSLSTFSLRPFCTSQTFANLSRTGVAVFHITDDVELLARSAIGEVREFPLLQPIDSPPGFALANSCGWFALRATTADLAPPRALFECEVVASQVGRPWLGFNRAKHAVVEAAILATRVGILSAQEIEQEMSRLEVLVRKTAGDQERQAWQLLVDYLHERLKA